MFKTYRKTATVEAVQMTAENALTLADRFEMVQVAPTGPSPAEEGALHSKHEIIVTTREGDIAAPVGEEPYLCRGDDGDLWLHDADLFEQRYVRDVPPADDQRVLLRGFVTFDTIAEGPDAVESRMMELLGRWLEELREFGYEHGLIEQPGAGRST